MLHIEGSPPVLSALDRDRRLAGDVGMAHVVMGQGRFLRPGKPLVGKDSQTFHGTRRSQGLVVVDHDGDVVAHRLANRANDREVLLHRGVSDLGLDPFEPAQGPVLGNPGGALDTVISDGAVSRNRFLHASHQPDQCRFVAACQGIPEGHVNGRQRHADRAPGFPAAESGKSRCSISTGARGSPLIRGSRLRTSFGGRSQRCGWCR